MISTLQEFKIRFKKLVTYDKPGTYVFHSIIFTKSIQKTEKNRFNGLFRKNYNQHLRYGLITLF